MPNADQFRLYPRFWHWSELIIIWINAAILIGINRHWLAFSNDPGSPVKVINCCNHTIISAIDHDFLFPGMCTSTFHLSRMFKQQKAACDDLKSRKFVNTARKVSYTTHHWVHVVMKSESWKRKSLVPITSIVPNIKNMTEVLRQLEEEYKRDNNVQAIKSWQKFHCFISFILFNLTMPLNFIYTDNMWLTRLRFTMAKACWSNLSQLRFD